ncbi:hypothetical protein [Methylacidiphilum caldifontis]|uniref:Uncharacterized protein n=1 Tax=Methylacidiphilum caldifontis TaxID=2795386 RepID=A0A4Y8P836_9BACT|nr:hypothetical protein [Methylacidiphilum caldifontis]TFE66562.1 hypothetical protein A7Q10_01960 [Methylacidiphilum caldifontis]
MFNPAISAKKNFFKEVLLRVLTICYRSGDELIEINLAYTSMIGTVNYVRRHGIGSHQSAAYAITWQGMGLWERPSMREAVVPAPNGGHVTFALPVRNRANHVWSFWTAVRNRLKAAHPAHGW